MAILLDPPIWPAHGRRWSHLASDVSFDELHLFAARVGLPSRAFDGDHYDVPAEMYDALVAAGARPVSGREILRALQSNSLRVQKRRGEQVLVARGESITLPPGSRYDLIASSLLSTVERATALWAMIFGGPDRCLLLIQRSDGGWGLPGGGRQVGESGRDALARHLHNQASFLVPLSPCGYQRTINVTGGLSTYQVYLTGVVQRPPSARSVTLSDGQLWCGDQTLKSHRAWTVEQPWWPLVVRQRTRLMQESDHQESTQGQSWG
ncbi:MAG: DUF4031 domain-containing protein [Actinomycetota bacterium]